MIMRPAIPWLILAVILLPLPFILTFLVFGVLLVVRPRGELVVACAAVRRLAGPTLLRSPPR